MNLAIIGAGESSRIKSEGLNTPKHLIKLGDEYLIERIIRIASENGADVISCIINENEPELKEYLCNHNFPVPIKCVVKNTQSSMHSLFELAPYNLEEPFILSTADSVFDEKEFASFVNYSTTQKEVEGVLAVTNYIDDEKPLCVRINEKGLIKEFSDSKEGYIWATGGLYYLDPSIFNEMQYALASGINRLRNYFRLLINKNYRLRTYHFSKIIDVDHVSDIKKAEDFIKSMKAKEIK
jgi:NDP-sugar pyrophosphorylase family protein